jgi:hypothetical protein
VGFFPVAALFSLRFTNIPLASKHLKEFASSLNSPLHIHQNEGRQSSSEKLWLDKQEDFHLKLS